MPVGFKNGTGGSVQLALDAIGASAGSHHFLSVTKQGVSAIVSTTGNDSCHIILRGGSNGPNYDADSIAETVTVLNEKGLPPYLMVDCSHGNSRKDFKNQPVVVKALADQISAGSTAISSVMIESNLVEGNQGLGDGDLAKLTHGQSVTDACISWESTEEVLATLATAVQKRRG
jgi:3-deoxy-7-phosphoheptulonate synthase